ncbi:unnamed protein product [Brachionus calyciflorus]|uniref:Uncharacterized protein n=1 Tax=Brachionus calyciflorus TaxID=104777 RepID=A0A813X6L0_9BILA|nr:unnamed protein product [Brachionus calyciflorus]
MPRITHFRDEKKLIDVTIKFMNDKFLTDLVGGFRPLNSPYQLISEIYSHGKSEPGAPACLYAKWNKNFKANVLTRLQKTEIQDDPMDNYFITISSLEWDKLKNSITGNSRKRFSASANNFFNHKIRSLGFECNLKMSSNSFSTSKKPIFGHNFWKGVFQYKNCEKKISGFIQNKPSHSNNILIEIKAENFQCLNKTEKEHRPRVTGNERKILQFEISSKGSSNFWNEADFFVKF